MSSGMTSQLPDAVWIARSQSTSAAAERLTRRSDALASPEASGSGPIAGVPWISDFPAGLQEHTFEPGDVMSSHSFATNLDLTSAQYFAIDGYGPSALRAG